MSERRTGTDNFRNLVLIGSGDQRPLCGGGNGIAPNALINDITQCVHMYILISNPLRRIIVAIVGLRSKNTILKHGNRQIVLFGGAIACIIHLNGNGGHTRLRVDDGQTSHVTFSSLTQLLVCQTCPLAPVGSSARMTIHDTCRNATKIKTVGNGSAIRAIEIGIGRRRKTRAMEIHCPNPTGMGSNDLVCFGMSIWAVAAVAACELLEDDVPVGRFRRYILLGFQ